MDQSLRSVVGVGSLLVLVCVVARLLPHPPNFTPVAAVALFAGAYFSRRWLAVAVVLVGMAISDVLLGAYDLGVMAVVYASLLLPILAKPLLADRVRFWRVGAAAVVCGIAFFLTTNAAVWWFGPYYPSGVEGLLASYIAGLPFLKWTLAGNVLWSLLLFGGYALAIRQPKVATVPG